ncbi:hypothetical protein D3C75_1011650 [compost metagenome]
MVFVCNGPLLNQAPQRFGYPAQNPLGYLLFLLDLFPLPDTPHGEAGDLAFLDGFPGIFICHFHSCHPGALRDLLIT